jgi:beta-N-acetylhexosaminidase
VSGRAFVAATALVLVAIPAPAHAAYSNDPNNWTSTQLAGQLVMAGVPMSSLSTARTWVANGIGGIVLLGTPPSNLGAQLASVRAAGPVVPFVASDEEGGQVQRLESVIYALPSAETMGATRTTSQVQAIAYDYGRRMRALGVDLDLAPVADLKIDGYYMERSDRAFATSPSTVGAFTTAWLRGMRSARVLTSAKHWPGHGQATDTHAGGATTPPLSTMQSRDMVPFDTVMANGVPSVMVGHLKVPGLTESGVPASLSPNAMRYLRRRLGGARLILTDSLSMAAITNMGLSPADAAVRALRAGADMALVTSDPLPVMSRIRAAIDAGTYPRASAIASVRRVLAAKRVVNAPGVPSSIRPTSGSQTMPVTGTMSAVVTDRVPGVDRALFYVRTKGASTWNVTNGFTTSVAAGSRAYYRVEAGRLRPATTYEFALRACNAAGLCATTGVGWFRTAA